MQTTLYVSWFTRKGAEAFDRRVHNVPNNVGLGWTPYTIRVTRGALPEIAFTNVKDFRRWLKQRGYCVVVFRARAAQPFRFGKLEVRQ